MSRLRISAISYLNTAPLMWDFEHGTAGADFDIAYTLPSQCAAELARGAADIGIIPAAAYATIPNLSILPGVAIASKKAVRSILLVSRKPLDAINTVALDNSSLTSVALTRVLFEKCWGGGREFTSLSPDLDTMLATNDAALLIGDPALKVDRSQFNTWDLADEWNQFTGKPFVFAFWAVRQNAAKETRLDLASIFQQSRDHGLLPASLAEITTHLVSQTRPEQRSRPRLPLRPTFITTWTNPASRACASSIATPANAAYCPAHPICISPTPSHH